MPRQLESLRVIVYDDYTLATRTQIFEFTGSVDQLTFSSALNGGFRRLTIAAQVPLEIAWNALARENLRGWHFYHIEVKEENRLIWEGRILSVEIDPSGVGPFRLEAVGYWSSTRDQDYVDSEGTDWTSGSHTVDDIIKEMLTNNCPDISTDQSNIEDPGLDVGGLQDLNTRKYVQEHILGSLPFTDSDGDQWYFAIWDNRIPYFSQRDISSVKWNVDRWMLGPSRLRQDATELRNNVLPVTNGSEGTAAADSDSQTLYPTRDLQITFAAGTPSGAANAERDRVLTERKDPQQSQSFTITSDPIDVGTVAGLGAIAPMWRVRAGEVLRIRDLVPPTVATISLDALTTFFLLEVTYDYVSHRLSVVPDRGRRKVTKYLKELGQLERGR